MGDHLDAGDGCRSDLMNFKLRYFPTIANGFGTDTVCDYDAIDPYTASTGTYATCNPADTTDAAYGACCFVDRHADHRSMYYLSQDASGQNFAPGVAIGQNVYGSTASAMTAGDLNGDGLHELIMADGVFINNAGTFNAVPDITFPGITSWKKLYVADMDAHNTYPDLVGVDMSGRTYIIRSSVTATDMTTTFEARFDTSMQTGKPVQQGNFMVECALQDETCTVDTICPGTCYQPFFYNTMSEFDFYLKPDAYPVWRAGDRLRATVANTAELAGSNCDAAKFLSTDLEVVHLEHFDMDTVRTTKTTEQADATWSATSAHYPTLRTHHKLRLRFVDGTVCNHWPAGPSGWWNPAITAMTLRGTPKHVAAQIRPASGQPPTFHPPQRIGGVGDVGAVDVAAVDVRAHNGLIDTQKDVCLLFRGRPVKCFVLPEMPINGPGQQVYDASNVKDVVYPDTLDHMHDAIGFARITASGVNRDFTAPGWQVDGEYLILNWEDDVSTIGLDERVAPGISAGSVIEITSWDATVDVSFILERNKNRFYVEEAGEFFIRVRTGVANWHYVEGSYNPCDSATTGTVFDRTVDETCADPSWITSSNKVQLCDVHGPICKRGTDNTDCTALGYGATVAYDTAYGSVQTIGADDDTCAFANNGFCKFRLCSNLPRTAYFRTNLLARY